VLAGHTITVQNWDKTITTIPNSVNFLTNEALEKMARFGLIDAYLNDKQGELAQWNAKVAEQHPEEVNTRRLTNLGTFRAYVERYLQHHPSIHQNMTLLVRQLSPTTHSIPLELYCFTNTTAWASYESIQSDIFFRLARHARNTVSTANGA